jgi:hypothetical protein
MPDDHRPAIAERVVGGCRNTIRLSIFAGRDHATLTVEVRIEGSARVPTRIVRLSREEARRLAALVLYQAAKLDRPRPRWRASDSESERQPARATPALP